MARNQPRPDVPMQYADSTGTFKTLHEATPDETVLVVESPSNLGELHAAWPVKLPDTLYTFASGSLGWNLPASVGIALAERDSGRNRPVWPLLATVPCKIFCSGTLVGGTA